MLQVISISPMWIIVLAGIALLLSAVMAGLSQQFVTLHVFVRMLKIFDLEFATSPLELATLINGIFAPNMPDHLKRKSSGSLKRFLVLSIICQILISVVFFLTCQVIAAAASGFHKSFFWTLGWLQVVSLFCGIFRAVFFLQYIRKDTKILSRRRFKIYELIEIIKWAIPLITGVVIISFFLFVWFSGNANYGLIDIVMLFVGEVIIVFLLKKYIIKPKPVSIERYREIGN